MYIIKFFGTKEMKTYKDFRKWKQDIKKLHEQGIKDSELVIAEIERGINEK